MSATMKQFVKEVSPMLKKLYSANISSRADYKAAVEAWSVEKMPRATESERRKFVDWACTIYDAMRKAGIDPNKPVVEWGEQLGKAVN